MVKKQRIVVIDDEVEICSLLKDLLTTEGYRVSTASDPVEGVWMVKKLQPDLVMLDLDMPKMSGVEVLRWIKKIHEPFVAIVMTGSDTPGSAKAAMRLGSFAHITKPFDLAQVKDLVKEALARS